jgi:hypothetical protein
MGLMKTRTRRSLEAALMAQNIGMVLCRTESRALQGNDKLQKGRILVNQPVFALTALR